MSLPMTTTSAAPLLRPDEVRPLLLDPLARMTVLGQVATTVFTTSHTLRVPGMGDADIADWTPEGQTIPLGEVGITESALTPARLTGGTVLSTELVKDSDPAVAEMIGHALAADLARKVDEAAWGSNVGTNNPERPAGLDDLTGCTVLTAKDGLSLNTFIDAAVAAELADTKIDTWVGHPSTVAEATKAAMSASVGVNLDGHAAAERRIMGVPLISSRHVQAGRLWGINRDTLLFVIREDATVEADSSVFFTSYQVALRALIRATWGVTRPASVVRLDVTPAA